MKLYIHNGWRDASFSMGTQTICLFRHFVFVWSAVITSLRCIKILPHIGADVCRRICFFASLLSPDLEQMVTLRTQRICHSRPSGFPPWGACCHDCLWRKTYVARYWGQSSRLLKTRIVGVICDYFENNTGRTVISRSRAPKSACHIISCLLK